MWITSLKVSDTVSTPQNYPKNTHVSYHFFVDKNTVSCSWLSSTSWAPRQPSTHMTWMTRDQTGRQTSASFSGDNKSRPHLRQSGSCQSSAPTAYLSIYISRVSAALGPINLGRGAEPGLQQKDNVFFYLQISLRIKMSDLYGIFGYWQNQTFLF